MITVAAGIIEKDDKILIARRKSLQLEENLWEFPGGKLKPGETLHDCLLREIKEELNIDIKTREVIEKSIFQKNDKVYELIGIKAIYISGEIELREHSEIRWVTIPELKNFSFLPADRPIVDKICRLNCGVSN